MKILVLMFALLSFGCAHNMSVGPLALEFEMNQAAKTASAKATVDGCALLSMMDIGGYLDGALDNLGEGCPSIHDDAGDQHAAGDKNDAGGS